MKSTPQMSWYSFLVTTVGSTVAESGVSDDDADDDRPLKDWGAKARPEPTDDAAIEAKNAARFVGKASMVINSPMDLCFLFPPSKYRPSLSLCFDSPDSYDKFGEWRPQSGNGDACVRRPTPLGDTLTVVLKSFSPVGIRVQGAN